MSAEASRDWDAVTYDRISAPQQAWADEQHLDLGRPVHDYLGGSPAERPDVYRLASPLSWVERSSKDIPCCVVWGTADPYSVPAHQSEPFVAALRRAGVTVEAVPLEGAGHMWFTLGPGQS